MALRLFRWVLNLTATSSLFTSVAASPAEIHSAYRNRDWARVEALASQFQDEPDVLFIQAMAAAHAGRFDHAITLLRRGIIASPHDARFALNAASMLHANGDWNSARTLLEEYIAADKRVGPAFLLLREIIGRAAQEHYARALGRDIARLTALPLIEPVAPIAKQAVATQQQTAGELSRCTLCPREDLQRSGIEFTAAQWGVPSSKGSDVFILGAAPLGPARMTDSFTAVFNVYAGTPTGARGYSPVWTGGWLHIALLEAGAPASALLWPGPQLIAAAVPSDLAASRPSNPAPHPEPVAPRPAEAQGRAERGAPGPASESRRLKGETADTVLRSLQIAMREWSSAWSSRNVDAYLTFYGPEFTGRQGETKLAWASRRRAALLRAGPIRLEVHMLHTEADPRGGVVIRFSQVYRTEEVAFESIKRLRWREYEGRWLIAAEEIEKEKRIR